MIEWLQKYKSVLSIRGIEQHLGMPDTALTKAVNGSQKLAKKWEQPLREFIEELKK